MHEKVRFANRFARPVFWRERVWASLQEERGGGAPWRMKVKIIDKIRIIIPEFFREATQNLHNHVLGGNDSFISAYMDMSMQK